MDAVVEVKGMYKKERPVGRLEREAKFHRVLVLCCL